MANWQDVSSDARYQKAPPDVQQKIRNEFFDSTIAAEIPEGVDAEPIRQEFMKRTEPAPEKGFLGKLNDAFINSSTPQTLSEKGLLKPQQQTSPRKVNAGFVTKPIGADEAMPEITAESLKADDGKKLDYAGELKQKPKRTLGGTAQDVALSTVEIVPTLAKGVADIGNLVTGDNVDIGASKEFQAQIDYLDSKKSAATQYEAEDYNRIKNSAAAETGDSYQFLFENPTLLTTKLVPTIGSMFTPAGVQAGVMKIAPGILGAKFTPRVAQALQAGSLSGTIAMQNAAETFNDADIKNLPMEERYKAATITALGTLLGNKIFNGGAEKIIADRFNKSGVGHGFLQAPIAMFNEGMQERVESLSGSAAKEFVAPDKMTLNRAISDSNDAQLMGTIMGGGASLATMSKGQQIIAKLKAQKAAQSNTTQEGDISQSELLNQANQYAGNEAIDATNLLDENVSDTNTDAAVVARAANELGDNTIGSDAASRETNGSGQLESAMPDSAATLEQGDGSNMAVGARVSERGAPLDNPTPEPQATLEAQAESFNAGNKPALLITRGETMPRNLPEDVKMAEIPDRGILVYRDEQTLQQALNGNMGEALGYGISEKPADTSQVVTARDENGTVIQDVATDGSQKVIDSAKQVAGNGTVEVRPIEQAMAERQAGISLDAISNDKSANDAATSKLNKLPEPTQAQKEAGNYKLGKVKVSGLDISIENPDKSIRSGQDRDGKQWKRAMSGHYGYVKGVKARAPDKEHVDVNVKPNTAEDYAGDVFIINQNHPDTGKFDEPKVYIGYADAKEAEAAYRSNYDKDWRGLGSIAQVPMDKFKEMLGNDKAFLKPISATKAASIIPETDEIFATRVESKRQDLKSWLPNFDWDVEGGRIIRNQDGDVSGRTVWTPKDQELDQLRQQSQSTYTDIRAALDAAINGTKTTGKQKRIVNLIMDYHDEVSQVINDDTINALLQEAGHDERQSSAEQQIYEQNGGVDSPTESVAKTTADSNIAGNQENAPSKTVAQNAVTGENQEVRTLLEKIVKRRAVGNELGKIKQFDDAVKATKSFMSGEKVSPTRFKLAAATFKSDPALHGALTQLHNLSKAPAKEARAEKANAIEAYKQRIADAKTVDALQTIAGEIQRDSTLTDAQATALDDAVFDAQDNLEGVENENDLSNNDTTQSENKPVQKYETSASTEINQELREDASKTKAQSKSAIDEITVESNNGSWFLRDGAELEDALDVDTNDTSEKRVDETQKNRQSSSKVKTTIQVDDNKATNFDWQAHWEAGKANRAESSLRHGILITYNDANNLSRKVLNEAISESPYRKYGKQFIRNGEFNSYGFMKFLLEKNEITQADFTNYLNYKELHDKGIFENSKLNEDAIRFAANVVKDKVTSHRDDFLEFYKNYLVDDKPTISKKDNNDLLGDNTAEKTDQLADKTFTTNAESDFGSVPVRDETIEIAKKSEKNHIVLEVIVRPNGNKWHNAFVSNGEGDFTTVNIGSDINKFTRNEILEKANESFNYRKEQSEKGKKIAADLVALAKEKGIKVGVTWNNPKAYVDSKKGLYEYDYATITSFDENTGVIGLTAYKRGMRQPSAFKTDINSRFFDNYPTPNTDLLGDNTQAKQAIADAERAKDAKRNAGEDNANDFKLTGSDRDSDKAAGNGAQDLFSQSAQKSKVDDYGEKLEGSRKDLARAMSKEYSDDEIASLPLSKLWPITDINLIENKTAAAIAWTAREEIPSKPRKDYAVKRWVDSVKKLRDIGYAASVALDKQNSEAMNKLRDDPKFLHFNDKVALLEAIDRDNWKRIGRVEAYPEAYKYNDGVKVPSPFVRVDIDGNTNQFRVSSVADAVDKVNEKLGNKAEDKRMAFEVRGRTGAYFVNKKGDKNYTKLKTFADSKAAFAFIKDNYDELLGLWEATKDRLNVKETDTRNKENRPRTGEDYRKGKDVSTEEFATTFGFRGVQFGEWVKQGGKDNDRQGALNAAYDALMDLANIVGVPPKAMSLEGTLGLAFGARGSGKHAAHFEAHSLIINLTKTNGAGSLAHEWFHALDNYFSRKRVMPSAERESSFITYKPEPLYVHKIHQDTAYTKAELARLRANNQKSTYLSAENWIKDPKHPEGVRPEVEERFADLVNALNASPMKERARAIDGVRIGADGYWSRIIELGARSFENYVIHKMQLHGYDNDYLANVVRVENFNRDPSRFPYLRDDELAPVAEAFDNLFTTIETKETDKGTVLFSRTATTKQKYEQRIDELFSGKKPNFIGTIALDNSDVLGMLGLGNKPLFVEESKVIAGKTKHPEMTAEVWKKIPQWLDSPAFVFDSATKENRLVFVAPELVKGNAITVIVDPAADKKGLSVSLVVNAYAKDSGLGFLRTWLEDGKLRFFSKEKSSLLRTRSALQLGSLVQAKSLSGRIYQDKDLVKYIAENKPSFSRNDPFFSLGTGTNLKLTKSKYQFGAKVLNKALVKYFGDDWSDSYESVDVPDTLSAYKQEIKVAFGKELRYVSPTREEFDIFAGVQLPRSPNSIYVNARAETNLTTIAGHELYHTLERTRPDLHKWFKSEAQKYIKDFGVYHENLNKKLKKGEIPYKEDVALSELLADFTGDALSDTQFLQELANADGNKFKGLLNATIRFLNHAIAKLENLGSSKYITDVEALRDSLKKALLAFSNGTPIVETTQNQTDTPIVENENINDNSSMSESEKQAAEFRDRYSAMEDLAREAAKRGMRLTKNVGSATVTIYHGTSNKNAEAIKSQGEFTGNTWFSSSERGTTEHSRPKHGKESTVIAIHADPRDIETTGANGELYAPNGLVKKDGIWMSPNRANDNNNDIRFSRQGSLNVTETQNKRDIALEPETWAQEKEREIRDKFNRFKVLQKNLELMTAREAGYKGDDIHAARDYMADNNVYNPINDASDVAQAETNMHGKISSRVEDFRELQLKPLIEKTQKFGIAVEDIAEFLKIQHAPEANKRMAEIHGDPNKTAYGISTQEANEAMADYKKLDWYADLKAISDEWRGITEQTKKILLDGGIISAEQASAWDAAYQLYVPVKGGDEASKAGTGKGLSVNGKIKKRLGHELRDERIIENILRDHERAIGLDEKNRVGMVMLKFLMEAQNDEIGTIAKPEKRQVLKNDKAYQVAYDGDVITAFTSKQDAQAFILENAAKTRRDTIKYGIETTTDQRVVMQASPMLGENEVNVYVAGHAIRIQLNDEIAARAYKNLGVEHLNALLSGAKEFNTWLSKAYTGWNPEFALKNLIRDALQGTVTLTGDYGVGMAAKIYANYPKAVKELAKARKDPRKSDVVSAYRKAGGSTGAAYLSDIERIGNDVMASYNEHAKVMNVFYSEKARFLEKGNGESLATSKALLNAGVSKFKKTPFIGHFLTMMERINAVTENALRVATFMTLQENGYSAPKAASAAKNLMNFNRKGEISNQAGAFYLFFNPNIQGTARLIETLGSSKNNGQARAVAGTMTLAAIVLAEMARGGDDEDKWKKIPSYVKDRNMVLMFGDTQVMLPVPYGYGVFHTLGNAISDYGHGEDGNKLGLRFADALFQNFSPVGNPIADEKFSPFQLLPTIPKMALAPTVNENSFGNAIAPKRYNEFTPDSQLMNRNTKGSVYDKTAYALNELTGGDKYRKGAVDVSPETLKFWVSSLTGGAGRFAVDAVNVPVMAAQGVAPDVKELPIVRSFVRESGVSDSRSAFWKAANEAKAAASEFSQAKKARDVMSAREIFNENKSLISLSKYANHLERMIKAKRDAIDEIRMDDTLSLADKRAKIKSIEAQEQAIYDRFLSRFKEIDN